MKKANKITYKIFAPIITDFAIEIEGLHKINKKRYIKKWQKAYDKCMYNIERIITYIRFPTKK